MGSYIGIWVVKLVAHLITSAALGVRIQTSLKNTKLATQANEWPTHSSPRKNIQKKLISLTQEYRTIENSVLNYISTTQLYSSQMLYENQKYLYGKSLATLVKLLTYQK
jgi:hypothetical protein